MVEETKNEENKTKPSKGINRYGGRNVHNVVYKK